MGSCLCEQYMAEKLEQQIQTPKPSLYKLSQPGGGGGAGYEISVIDSQPEKLYQRVFLRLLS